MEVVEHAVMVGYTSWVVVYLLVSITVVVFVSTEHFELVELILVHVVRLQLYLALFLPVTWTSISALRALILMLSEQVISFLILQDVVPHVKLIVHSSVDKN